jgi:hypothetical protein
MSLGSNSQSSLQGKLCSYTIQLVICILLDFKTFEERCCPQHGGLLIKHTHVICSNNLIETLEPVYNMMRIGKPHTVYAKNLNLLRFGRHMHHIQGMHHILCAWVPRVCSVLHWSHSSKILGLVGSKTCRIKLFVVIVVYDLST